MAVCGYVVLVAAVLTALATVLAGVGLGLRRLFGISHLPTEDILVAPWAGLAVVIAALQIWHLVLPIDGRALALVVALGAAGFLINLRPLAGALPGALAGRWRGILVLFVWILWVAAHTTTQARVLDSGLYHFNSIRWNCTYPIVPGLGNLHGRLAFNSSYFLYAALFNSGILSGRCHHIANGLLLVLLFARILPAVWKVVSWSEEPRTWHVFDALMLAPAIGYTLSEAASSPTPDLAVSIIGMVAASEVLRLLSEPAARRWDGQQLGWRAAMVLLLAATGVTIKLSFTGLACAAGALAVATLGRRAVRPAAGAGLLCGTSLGVVIILGMWLLRGVILSGYPVYPLAFCGLPVEWRMPRETVQLHGAWVRSWARLPGFPPD